MIYIPRSTSDICQCLFQIDFFNAYCIHMAVDAMHFTIMQSFSGAAQWLHYCLTARRS